MNLKHKKSSKTQLFERIYSLETVRFVRSLEEILQQWLFVFTDPLQLTISPGHCVESRGGQTADLHLGRNIGQKTVTRRTTPSCIYGNLWSAIIASMPTFGRVNELAKSAEACKNWISSWSFTQNQRWQSKVCNAWTERAITGDRTQVPGLLASYSSSSICWEKSGKSSERNADKHMEDCMHVQ